MYIINVLFAKICFLGIIIFLRVCCAFSLGYRAAGRGGGGTVSLPCGGICFYAPTRRHTILVRAGLVALFMVVPFFFAFAGGA